MAAGVPQVFLRLRGCNLACRYCDTPGAREVSGTCCVCDWGGLLEEIPNPVGVPEAVAWISRLWGGGIHSLSLTGGEPLLQAGELAELLPPLRGKGIGVYLETNGTLHRELGRLLPYIDCVAMDVKLPSGQGGRNLIDEHRAFLRLACTRRVFLKCVIEPETGEEELAAACRALAAVAPEAPLVLQPATPPAGGEWISPRRAFKLYGIAAGYFREVRMTPQMQRLWVIG